MRRLLLALPFLASMAYFAGCGDDETSAPTNPDAAVPTFDATSARPDVSDAAEDAENDAGTSGDADAAVDADADADPGPQFDDAGCPLGTNAASSATDAGIPTTGIALWLRADLGVATVDGGAVCR